MIVKMGDVINVDFSESSAFHEEMNDIIDDFISCLGKHYGDEAGYLMAKSLTVCLEEIVSKVTKQLELMEAENESNVEFTPDKDLDIDISFNPEIKLP
ncbi:MAG: hypothetical protein MK369_08595 [SAR202 cluster bacterium]|nr:hypothetical protein [SAR202 cluster bacterium]